MCILISTVEHPDYPFILLSNRDEYFARPTQRAHVRDLPNGTKILSPLDLGRAEHGTWIGVTSTGRLAVLVNYREDDHTLSEVSRGILPLEWLGLEDSDDVWHENLERKLANITIGTTQVSLRRIGGFSLLYGQLDVNSQTGKIDHLSILSNRGDHGRVHDANAIEKEGKHLDVAHETTFGLLNSLYYEPWQKVELGKEKLRETVRKSVDEKFTHDELIEACFGVLSYNTFDSAKAALAKSINEKFLELRKSVFIPPLHTGMSSLAAENPTIGTYYGTRTQTVIALHNSGTLHYYERDIHDTDTSVSNVHRQHYSFPLSASE